MQDWVLSLMYRYQKLALSAAGIAPVRVPGVEDIDVSDVIKGHQQYSSRIRDCLLKVGLDDCFAPESSRRTDTRASTAVPGAVVEEAAEEEEDGGALAREQQEGVLGATVPSRSGRGSVSQPPLSSLRKDSDDMGEPATILY